MLGGGGTPAGARGDSEGRVQVGAGWVGGHRGHGIARGMWCHEELLSPCGRTERWQQAMLGWDLPALCYEEPQRYGEDWCRAMG